MADDFCKFSTTREAEGHLWLNLDWQAAFPGGPYYNCINRDAYPCVAGNWTWVKLK